MKRLTFALLLAGCTADKDVTDSAVDSNPIVDEDGDGVSAEEDCDDNDASVYPGATEVCDAVDNNCDGAVDEGVTTTWYSDNDADGFGADETAQEACEAPPGTVGVGGDCDDDDAAFYPNAPETDCTDPNDYNCDGSVGYADNDGDGWPACEECDDGDAAINPDALEVCDDVDNDCDGDIDDDDDGVDTSTGALFYADVDGDGYGDPSDVIEACDAPSGYVSDNTDCDDGDAAINPSATEICDGIDNDCDGDVDDDDASVDTSTGSTWYLDSDSDGYGDADATLDACDQPSGYVADNNDCDDGANAVNPGATEYCDSIDNNCDGTVDEDSAADASTWYADADSDTYGDPSSSDVACDQPSGYVSDNTDCDDSDGAINPAATEVCDGDDNDCDGLTDDDSAADVSTWYADTDSDTYGDASVSDVDCYQPSGYVADATDCDDSNANANPGETEYCDGFDNDCDGLTDDDGAADVLDWYEDADGDTYGNPSVSDVDCYQPSGYVADDTDCDDAEATTNPGASEICDLIDNDCDGVVDNSLSTYGGGADCPGSSCDDILSVLGSASDGAYYIDPDTTGAFEVYCDMSYDGGGWTLLFTHTADDATYGSGWDGWWGDGMTTVVNTTTTNGKSEAYDTVDFQEIMLTATEPDASRLTSNTGSVHNDMHELVGTEPTTCSGLTSQGRYHYSATIVSGSYFPVATLDIVQCDSDGDSLETTSGGHYDLAIFDSFNGHGDHNYANGDIGSEFRVGGYTGTSTASSSNRVSVWVR
ncbi:MAG: hypothetical protein H6739_20450 [Alphaproteobacteria bacterium]|nr:hypothetical protein [Alphaproteobacteria bacterium]